MLRYVAALFVLAGLLIFSGCSPSGTSVSTDEELVAPPQVVSLSEEQLPSAAAAALEQGTEFELLSLEPNGGMVSEGENHFYGFEVLGTLAIDDPATQDEIVAAFKRGIADNLDQEAAACFAPRHGIRVMHDGKVHEFVICFECEITTWYVDGSQAGGMYPTSVAQPEFDRVLKDAGIRLPKPQGDFRNKQQGSELRQIENAGVPTMVPSGPENSLAPEFGAELALIVTAWSTLPASMRQSIVAMIQAATSVDSASR